LPDNNGFESPATRAGGASGERLSVSRIDNTASGVVGRGHGGAVIGGGAVEQPGAAASRSPVTPDLHLTRRYGPASSNTEWTAQYADLRK
jgi:hypothetical protein